MPNPFGPSIRTKRIKKDYFTDIHGGKLYGIRIIAQVLWAIDIDLNGLNPSIAKPNLIFWQSAVKDGFH